MSDLDRPVAIGRTAAVHPYGPGRVLKLARRGAVSSLEYEQRALEAARAAGLPVPRSFGTLEIDGRPGLILEAGEPRSLQWRLEHGAAELEAAARLGAELQARVHAAAAPSLPPVKERLHKRIAALRDRGLPPVEIAAAALRRLEDLPDGTSLLHGDFHPGNLLPAPLGGWWIIDWVDAARGDPAADLARSWVLFNFHLTREDEAPRSAAEYAELGRRFWNAHLGRYSELTGLEPAAVEAWKLPVAVARLGEGIPGLERLLVPRCRQLAQG